MSRPRLRPRVSLDLHAPPEAVCATLKTRLQGDAPWTGRGARQHVYIELERRSLFSPTLDVHLWPDDDGGTRLRGKVGPHPELWTALVASYAVCAAVAISGASYAMAQFTLGWPLTALWFVALGAAGAAVLWAAAWMGRRAAADDIPRLLAALDDLAASVDRAAAAEVCAACEHEREAAGAGPCPHKVVPIMLGGRPGT
jgi:hypothetical protein